MIRVCFVCLGNICRSPTAQGVMAHLLAGAGLDRHVSVESAGTADYHVGAAPDARALRAARRRGIELPSRARHFTASDFERFDYVLAMDQNNLRDLRALSGGRFDDRLGLLLQFDVESVPGAGVPDPYYGSDQGFDEVLELCMRGCRGFLRVLIERHGLHRDG